MVHAHFLTRNPPIKDFKFWERSLYYLAPRGRPQNWLAGSWRRDTKSGSGNMMKRQQSYTICVEPRWTCIPRLWSQDTYKSQIVGHGLESANLGWTLVAYVHFAAKNNYYLCRRTANPYSTNFFLGGTTEMAMDVDVGECTVGGSRQLDCGGN